MNRTLALLALLALSIAKAHASDIQSIDCHYTNPGAKDHVIVSLKDPQNGTFSYSTGIVDDDQNTGSIGILRDADSNEPGKKDFARFTARWMTVQDGSKITVEFHFSMPKNLVFKNSNSFKAGLTTNIIDYNQTKPLSLDSDDELVCSAKIGPTNATRQ